VLKIPLEDPFASQALMPGIDYRCSRLACELQGIGTLYKPLVHGSFCCALTEKLLPPVQKRHPFAVTWRRTAGNQPSLLLAIRAFSEAPVASLVDLSKDYGARSKNGGFPSRR